MTESSTATSGSPAPKPAAARSRLKRAICRRVRDAIWRMRGPDDLTEVLAEIRRALEELQLPLMFCGVNVVDATAEPPQMISHSLSPKGEQHRLLSVGAGKAMRFWQDQEVVYRRNLERDDPFDEQRFFDGVACIVDVPFSHGTLAVSSGRPEAFSDDDVQVLEEMALLLEDGFRRREELTQLEAQHRLREQVWRMRHQEDVVQVMVALRETLEALGVRYTACAINVLERGATGLEMRVHNMTRSGEWKKTGPGGWPVVEAFWRAGVPAYRRDLEREDPHGELEMLSEHYGVPIRSVLDVPFSHGTLALNSTEPDAFREDQVVFLQEMAEVLGEAFRRMEDLQRLAERNQRLEMEVADRRRAEQRLASSLDEKVVLLKEIHHRVKNNLQVVSSLLNLSANSIADAEARQRFNDSRARIESMALVHERLYESEDLARIDCGEYLRALVDNLLSSYGMEPGRVRAEVEASPLRLDVDRALQCGLIVNELVANALKHAFPKGRRGTVRVTLASADDTVSLQVSDDGVGLPEGLDLDTSESLGLQLVVGLGAQLQGSVRCSGEEGASFELQFPLHPKRREPADAGT